MILAKDIAQIKTSIEEIRMLVGGLPEWIPLSDQMAQQYGYKTADGLREWCKRNIEPTKFKKFGRLYHLHKTSLGLLSLSR
jgi:hypothetical protein